MPAVVLRFPVFSTEARPSAVSCLARAMDQTFKFSRQGADVRAQHVPGTAPASSPFITVSDNVVYSVVAGLLADNSVGKLPNLRALLAVTVPDKGEVRLCFAADAFPFSLAHSLFFICARDADESQKEARDAAVWPWKPMLSAYCAAKEAFRIVAGSPVRFQIGGFGGALGQVLYPQPAPRSVYGG